MNAAFEKAINRVLSSEGGYVNDPKDPGGETQWGISKRAYPTINIKTLTREGAKAIYEVDFWLPLGDMHPALKFQMLDAAVNHGISNANRFMQRAAAVADDGVIGPVTRAAVTEMVNEYGVNDMLLRFLAYRLKFMTKLTTFSRFGAGWSNRIADDLIYAAEDN